MSKEEIWHHRWLRLTKEVATWSKDPSSKIGAVIVDSSNRIVSLGYNGFAENVEETPERWERPLKYEYVIHAEVNAILNARHRDVSDCTLYVSTHPCHKCLMQIINAGIKAIYWIAPTEDFASRWLTPEKMEIFNSALCESNIQKAVEIQLPE